MKSSEMRDAANRCLREARETSGAVRADIAGDVTTWQESQERLERALKNAQFLCASLIKAADALQIAERIERDERARATRSAQ